MKETLKGFETERTKGHCHYWVLHIEGHRFCSGCTAKKINNKVVFP